IRIRQHSCSAGQQRSFEGKNHLINSPAESGLTEEKTSSYDAPANICDSVDQ
ncbi:hypothetical protein CEXT_182361, partial [Caerostris extrusa]